MLSLRSNAVHGDGPSHTIYTKTPGRNMIKARNALQENVLYHPPGSVVVKTKTVHTPLRPRIGKSAFGNAKVPVTITRPLGDKTPFPNRTLNTAALDTPSPRITKLPSLDPSDDLPVSVPRPSATRRHLRVPRVSAEYKQAPVTPASRNQASHWDVGELSVSEPRAENINQEDHDEIEYMPPKAIGIISHSK